MNRYYLCRLIAYTLLLIAIGCMLNSCSNTRTKYDYDLCHYTDTINGHIILTTVCTKDLNISINTIELENLNK